MLNTLNLNFSISEKNSNELSNCISKLAEGIKSYDLLQNDTAQLTSEQDKQAIYAVLGHEYYWEHLKKAELLKGSDKYSLNEIQAKKYAYQQVVNGEKILDEELNTLTEKEIITRTILPPYSKLNSQIKLNKLKNEFETLKQEAQHIETLSLLNAKLNKLLLIAEQCQAIIQYYEKYKKNIQFNNTTDAEFKKSINAIKQQSILMWIEKSKSLITLMNIVGRHGHTDKLHDFVGKMNSYYPNAAVSSPPSNYAPSEDQIAIAYTNFVNFFKVESSLTSQSQQKQIDRVVKELEHIPWINWGLPELKKTKGKFDLRDKAIAKLVTDSHVVNSLNKTSQVLKRLNEKKSESGSTHINQSKIQTEDEKKLSSSMGKPSAFYEALLANEQAIKYRKKLKSEMGWTFSVLERIFSTNKYQSFQAVKNTLMQQKIDLKIYHDNFLTDDIYHEVDSVFNKFKNFNDITAYFSSTSKKLSMLRGSNQIEKWKLNYRKQIIKCLINSITEKSMALDNKNLSQLIADGFLLVEDTNRLRCLMACMKDWEKAKKHYSKNYINVLNTYLDAYVPGLNLSKINSEKALCLVKSYNENKNFKMRIFEDDKLNFMFEFAGEELSSWVIENINIFSNDISKLSIEELVDYVKLIQLSLKAGQFYKGDSRINLAVALEKLKEINDKIKVFIKASHNCQDYKLYYEILSILNESSYVVGHEKDIASENTVVISSAISDRKDIASSLLLLGKKYIKLTCNSMFKENTIINSLHDHNYFGNLSTLVNAIYFNSIKTADARTIFCEDWINQEELNYTLGKIINKHELWVKEKNKDIETNLYCLIKEMIHHNMSLDPTNARYMEAILSEGLVNQLMNEDIPVIDAINLVKKLDKYGININYTLLVQKINDAYKRADGENYQVRLEEISFTVNRKAILQTFCRNIEALKLREDLLPLKLPTLTHKPIIFQPPNSDSFAIFNLKVKNLMPIEAISTFIELINKNSVSKLANKLDLVAKMILSFNLIKEKVLELKSENINNLLNNIIFDFEDLLVIVKPNRNTDTTATDIIELENTLLEKLQVLLSEVNDLSMHEISKISKK